MLVLQHGISQDVRRRRAPLDSSVSQAIRDALEQGDWLTVRSDTGLYEPVANLAAGVTSVFRVAWPIAIEPTQPDAQVAGMMVLHGDYFAMTDRFAADPTFAGYAGPDVPAAPRPLAVAAYAKGVPLIAAAFEPVAGGGGAGPFVYGLTTGHAVAATAAYLNEVAATVGYVERAPADNNDLLQFVTF